MKRYWTPKEEEILKKLVAANRTMPEILIVLKSRTDRAIRAKLQAMNLPLPSTGVEIDFAAFEKFMKTGGKRGSIGM
jgi:hypothetical protein